MRYFFAMLLTLVFNFALADLNQAVPVQSFEQASTPPAPITSIPTKASPPTTVAPAQTVATPTTAPTLPATTAVQPVATNVVGDKEMQAQLTQLNQNFIQYQQKTDEQLMLLSNQQTLMAGDINRMKSALVLLNQEVSTPDKSSAAVMAPTVQSGKNDQNISWIYFWEQRLGRVGVVVLMILILVALFLMSRWVWKRKPANKVYSDTGDEYDYMGSEESIPAKLNLARAYIKMENFAEAKIALKEVIEKGGPEQQLAAKELLKKCQ